MEVIKNQDANAQRAVVLRKSAAASLDHATSMPNSCPATSFGHPRWPRVADFMAV